MSNSFRDKPLTTFFEEEVIRIKKCYKCGKTIMNEISVKYMLCSECFSKIFNRKPESIY